MTLKQTNSFKNLKSHKFELGQIYQVRFFSKIFICKFIRVTKTGYNLLALEKNVCILSSPIYIIKKYSTDKNKYFLINKYITIQKINE